MSVGHVILGGRGLGRDQEAQSPLAVGRQVGRGGAPGAGQVACSPAHLGQIQRSRRVQEVVSGQRLVLRTGPVKRPGPQVQPGEADLRGWIGDGGCSGTDRLEAWSRGRIGPGRLGRLQRNPEEAIARVALDRREPADGLGHRGHVECLGGFGLGRGLGRLDGLAPRRLYRHANRQFNDLLDALDLGRLRETRSRDRRLPPGPGAIPHAAPPGSRSIASSPRSRARPRGATAASRSTSSRMRRPARAWMPSEVTASSSLSA